MPNRDAVEVLKQGADILGAKLYPLGFTFECFGPIHGGSGGSYASGSFRNGDREITLWFRFHLGEVRYRKGNVGHPHQALMQYLCLEDQARYPGYQSADPLSGFRDLLADFEYCTLFFENEGRGFEQAMRHFVYRDPPTGFAALSRHDKK